MYTHERKQPGIWAVINRPKHTVVCMYDASKLQLKSLRWLAASLSEKHLLSWVAKFKIKVLIPHCLWRNTVSCWGSLLLLHHKVHIGSFPWIFLANSFCLSSTDAAGVVCESAEVNLPLICVSRWAIQGEASPIDLLPTKDRVQKQDGFHISIIWCDSSSLRGYRFSATDSRS